MSEVADFAQAGRYYNVVLTTSRDTDEDRGAGGIPHKSLGILRFSCPIAVRARGPLGHEVSGLERCRGGAHADTVRAIGVVGPFDGDFAKADLVSERPCPNLSGRVAYGRWLEVSRMD